MVSLLARGVDSLLVARSMSGHVPRAMARSLAQTKHLDTTDCLAWRLCFGNLQIKVTGPTTAGTASGGVFREHRGVACHDAIDQRGTRRALGLRQASRARKEPMLLPDSTLHHVRHPFRPSRFLCR